MKALKLVKDEQLDAWANWQEYNKYVFFNRMTLATWECYAADENHATYLLNLEYDELYRWFLIE